MSSDLVPSDTLPALSVFEHACRQTRRAAPGYDGFAGALVNAFATELAALYYAFQLKTAVTLIEPVQWKGDFYHDLLKSITADPIACASSRSILVSSQLGKASRRCLRT
eukprot:3876466-Pyramimonas_sp.AAC.2